MTWYINDPFPASALGKILGPAVWQHHGNSQLSLDLIAPIALGLAAATVQDLCDVHRPNLPPSPISLFVAEIAGTGEGRDAAPAPWLRPFLQFQAEADEKYEEGRLAFEVEFKAWRAIRRGKMPGEGCRRGRPRRSEAKRLDDASIAGDAS